MGHFLFFTGILLFCYINEVESYDYCSRYLRCPNGYHCCQYNTKCCSSTNIGAIVGIVVTIAFVAGICILICIICKRRRRRNQPGTVVVQNQPTPGVAVFTHTAGPAVYPNLGIPGQPGYIQQPPYYGQPPSYGYPGSNGQPASQGHPGSYGQPASQGQPSSHGQPASYGQPSSQGQNGPYEQLESYGQSGPYEQLGSFGQPGSAEDQKSMAPPPYTPN